jgi:hypothetical protein
VVGLLRQRHELVAFGWVKYCGPVVASVASDSSAARRGSTGWPLSVVCWPATPSQRSPRIGWSITPSTGKPSTSSAISVPKIGRPARKAWCRRSGRAPIAPRAAFGDAELLAVTPSCGTSAVRMRRIASSAARSATVTGVASALRSASTGVRKCGRIAARAASARR